MTQTIVGVPPADAVQEALRKENLSQADYEEICRRLGRPPNRAELGMFGVMCRSTVATAIPSRS